MANRDLADLLTDSFTSLRLFSQRPPEPPRTFTCFPNLPTELRLKIFTHVLAPPSVLDVSAQVIISDPSFGLYITFCIPTKGTRRGRSLSPDRRALIQSRELALLATTHESRDAYLSVYKIALPYSTSRGILRISKDELLHWDQFHEILSQRSFQNAILHDYRLQDFWAQIGNLGIPISCFVPNTKDNSPPKVLSRLLSMKMTGLKQLNGVMWEGFKGLDEGQAKTMMGARMRHFMVRMEAELKAFEEENEGYTGPSFEMLD